MYYPQQSPSIQHKLSHDQNPWTRAAPGYAMYNGTMHPQPFAHAPMHHHQNSINHYSSPPTHPPQISPATMSGQVMSQHWQQQLLKYEMSRSSRSPHHRARANAMAARSHQKSAIPITNPNAIKSPPAIEASPEDSGSPANHPSATVAPIAVARGTMNGTRPTENNWTSLDMGGVSIKTLPPISKLWSWRFLVNLYLNHNQLTSLPPGIRYLRQLEHLDVSGNALTSLPPEIGMLSSLKEFYLFDNHITTLPPQMGFLFALQTLGVEGNPLESSLKAMIQNQGTRAVIVWLRDNSPDPPEPPPRTWKYFLPPAEYEQVVNDPATENFTLMCYNILCERAAVEKLYGYTPKPMLQWEWRKKVILNQLHSADSDFLCLQEVEHAQFNEFFQPNMLPKYKGVFSPKGRWKNKSDYDRRTVDGCAIFYRADKWELRASHVIDITQLAMQRPDFAKDDVMFNRVLQRDNVAVFVMLQNRMTGMKIVIANAHMHWDAMMSDVKLVQTGIMVEEIQSLLQAQEDTDEEGLTWSHYPLIVCGDYNSVPSSGVYEFLSTGSVSPNHPDFLDGVYGRYTSEGMRHKLGLRSAYAGYRQEPRHVEDETDRGTELPMTNWTPPFSGVLDYIWYSGATLAVNKVLGEVDKTYMSTVPGLPNSHFPSDHISLMAEFRVKPRPNMGKAVGY